MHIRILLIALMLNACGFTPLAIAAPVALDPMTPPHQDLSMASRVMAEVRSITVYLPPNYYRDRSQRYPVLYMPDGGLHEDFPHVAATADRLIRTGDVRPFIIVGVANTVRRRDMTGPTTAPKDLEVTAEPGGAARFRRFFQDELMPEVQKRYRVDGEAAILGESLAGLFIVESLMLEPTIFDTYIALDPSLWWNNAGLIRDAKQHLARLGDQPIRLLIASGGKESNVNDVEALTDELRQAAPANLQWEYLARPDLRHDTIYRALEETVLRKAFAKTDPKRK